jgi:replicative DNA helicase
LDANQGRKGLFFSMEMTEQQIVRRILASDTGVSTRAQRAGAINEGEFDLLWDSAKSLRNIPVFVDGSGRQTVSQVATKCRSMKRRHGIGQAAIDHVKLFKSSNPRLTDIDIINKAAFSLKDLAKELGIIIFLLCQPTREGQKNRDNWRVYDQDIYGGDTIKQCSDVLMSISIPCKWLAQNEADRSNSHAYEAWVRNMTEWKDKAEVGLLKNRDGPDGLWRKLAYDGERVKFGDL